MSYAIQKNGGWRAVNGPEDVGPDETYSETEPPIIDDLAGNARASRALLLTIADIEINKIEDVGGDATAWRKYRQALRDITKQVAFPATIIWPELPK